MGRKREAVERVEDKVEPVNNFRPEGAFAFGLYTLLVDLVGELEEFEHAEYHTTRVEDKTRERGWRLCGDVDFEHVAPKCSYITPVLAVWDP